MTKIYLCSFADSFYKNASKRFKQQAAELNIFDDIFIYDEYDLDSDFRLKFCDKLKFSTRGFGYWVWKPHIILKTLEKIDDDSILIYADIGCHINNINIKKFNYYINIVAENNFLSFSLKSFDNKSFKEEIWTKADLFDYFNVLNKDEIINTDQICTTNFYLKKTNENVKFLKRWQKVYYDNFNLADDSPSLIPNVNNFIEHRHDQSIFSILVKLNQFHVLNYEYYDEPITHNRDKEHYFKYIYKITNYFPSNNIINNIKYKLNNLLLPYIYYKFIY